MIFLPCIIMKSITEYFLSFKNKCLNSPPRASDSDFTEERPPRKTLQYRPRKAHVGLSQIDDHSRGRLSGPILTTSFEDGICKANTYEDHHEQTTRSRASSPQGQPPPPAGKSRAKLLLGAPCQPPHAANLSRAMSSLNCIPPPRYLRQHHAKAITKPRKTDPATQNRLPPSSVQHFGSLAQWLLPKRTTTKAR
jgi:hypothetical protein